MQVSPVVARTLQQPQDQSPDLMYSAAHFWVPFQVLSESFAQRDWGASSFFRQPSVLNATQSVWSAHACLRSSNVRVALALKPQSRSANWESLPLCISQPSNGLHAAR
jgi:hypothetical protein